MALEGFFGLFKMPSRNEVMHEIKKIYKELDNLEFLIEIAILAEAHKQAESKKQMIHRSCC